VTEAAYCERYGSVGILPAHALRVDAPRRPSANVAIGLVGNKNVTLVSRSSSPVEPALCPRGADPPDHPHCDRCSSRAQLLEPTRGTRMLPNAETLMPRRKN